MNQFKAGDRVRIRQDANDRYWGPAARDDKASRSILTISEVLNTGNSTCWFLERPDPNKYVLYPEHLELAEEITMEDVIEPTAKRTRTSKFEKQKRAIKDVIIGATDLFSAKNKYSEIKKDDNKYAALEKELLYWRTNISQVESDSLARIFTALTGTPIKSTGAVPRLLTWTKFAAVWVIVARDGHNYPINNVSIVTADNKMLRPDGTYGNAIGNHIDQMRPATLEEIDKITDETYAALIREYLIV